MIYREFTRKAVYTLIPQFQADGSANVIIRVGSISADNVFEQLMPDTSQYLKPEEVNQLRGTPSEDEAGKDPFSVLEGRLETYMRTTGRLKL